MDEVSKSIQDISEIRSLMERSAKFISLSGLSGVSAGVIALVGAAGTWYYLQVNGIWQHLQFEHGARNAGRLMRYTFTQGHLWALIGIALLILFAAVGAATFFSIRMARKKNLPVWSKTGKLLLISLLTPLIAGAIFCVQLAMHNFVWAVPSATLIFYGLALINASKYTLREIEYLGYSEVILGLISAFWMHDGTWMLAFWAFGFGVFHIVYGILMYLKYER